ncbi:MAG: hypothetical protein MR416_05215, partial [Lachnospiraceae bacterium]|nr:hypothetical protein [Lachnospiraceae bacterium]
PPSTPTLRSRSESAGTHSADFEQQLRGEFPVFPLLPHTSRQLSEFRSKGTIPLHRFIDYDDSIFFSKMEEKFFEIM